MSAASLHHHICLICGCNTNQIINIYEPRSGPNIVELIQAKFKFQPLNEDKYLCFSCNNWLINWHSLQANNSNDAESPSGTFRSSQVNGGMAQEKHAASQKNQPPSQSQSPFQSQSQHPNQKQQYGRQKPIGSTPATRAYRPIAEVRPRQLSEKVELQSELETKTTISIPKSQLEYFNSNVNSNSKSNAIVNAVSKKFIQHNYTKRSMKGIYRYRYRRSSKKHLNYCSLCGRSIVIYIRTTCGALRPVSQSMQTGKCRKCRNVYRSIHMRNSTKERTKNSCIKNNLAPQSLVDQVIGNANNCPEIAPTVSVSVSVSGNQSQYLNRPLVDGKIVAMLRRLGTTLSREHVSSKNSHQLPPIMSPTKPKPRWTRPLEADEILLHFETAISEVLPNTLKSTKESKKTTPTTTRRKLTYQMLYENDSELETDTQTNIQECVRMTSAYEDILCSLPKGLNVSLI